MNGKAFHLRSFTLVELLLALSLAGLVVSITGPIAVSTLKARQVVTQQLDHSQVERFLLDVLSDDIRSILFEPLGAKPTIRLEAGARQVLEIESLIAERNVSLHESRLPAVIRYRVVNGSDGSSRLVREVNDRTKPGSSATSQIVATNVQYWQVEVFSGHQWQRFLTPDSEPVEAVRITCQWDSKSVNHTYRIRHEY